MPQQQLEGRRRERGRREGRKAALLPLLIDYETAELDQISNYTTVEIERLLIGRTD
jgi:hypothetical protein